MEIIRDINQRDPEWFKLKNGRVSASHAKDILSMTGATGSQKNYMLSLAGEVLGGEKDHFESHDMKRGTELESDAREQYEWKSGNKVEEVALIFKDKDKRVLCSPDGIMMDIGTGFEVKCPKMHTHVEYLLKKRVPPVYFPQVQSSMYVTGFDKWVFMSYYPGLDPLIITVKRDNEWIEKFEVELKKFLKKLDETINKLRS